MANFDALEGFLESQKPVPQKKKSYSEQDEEELDFIEETWKPVKPNNETMDVTETSQPEQPQLTEEVPTTSLGKATKVVWNTAKLPETKKNIQFTLLPSQIEIMKDAAGQRVPLRRDKVGTPVPNPSSFLQKLIDMEIWSAYDFLVDQNLINDFNAWKINQRRGQS